MNMKFLAVVTFSTSICQVSFLYTLESSGEIPRYGMSWIRGRYHF